jgi:hypothetical protein
VAVHNVAAAEALVLARARLCSNLDLVLEAIGAGAGSSRMFQVRGPKVVARDYAPTVRLEVFLKDLALITGFAEDPRREHADARGEPRVVRRGARPRLGRRRPGARAPSCSGSRRPPRGQADARGRW